MSEISVPFLSEHEAPNASQSQKPGYQPSEEEKETLRFAEKIYSRAKKFRKRYDQKWIDYYKMFRGRQWKEVRPSYRHSEVINLVFQTIQSMVPILTDSRPKIDYLPTVPNDPGQTDLADILSKVADNDWQHNNWLMTLTEMLYDSHFYGTAFGHCGHDPEANFGLGNILFESADPFYSFPCPEARDLNDKRCADFTYAEPVRLSKLKSEYPDKAQYLTADVVDLAQGDKADIYQVMFKSPVDSKLILEGSSGYDSLQKDQTLKITTWVKDDTLEEIEEAAETEDGGIQVDEMGKPVSKYVQKKKYPKGRKIVHSAGILLEDSEFEFEDGKIPYAKLVNYILPREFWGMGEIDQMEGPQKTFNKILSYALDVMTLMGNPIWVVGTQANIDTDNLFNKPGLIVESDDISQIRREPGVELQPFVMNLLQNYRTMIDGVSGQTDLSRGVEPTDVTAASAISELQQAQQTRARLKTRNLDGFLQQFGLMYLDRVFQFYNVPRIVRVTGDDNVEDFFHFHVEAFDRADGSQGKRAVITKYGDNGEVNTQYIEITGQFDVRVSTGSALPFAKKEKTEISFNLFKLGVIDDEELLKNLEYPNWEQVLQRVQAKKQAAQQAQMQQQMAMKQAQGGAPPGPGPAQPQPAPG